MFEPIVIWDLEDDADGNYMRIVAEHDISQDEVEDVVGDRKNKTVPSDSSGRPLTFGWTRTGRYGRSRLGARRGQPADHQTGDRLRSSTSKEARETAMSVRRVYQKSKRTAAELANLRAERARYQLDKPTLEEALAASGHERALPLGEVILLHELLGLLKKERQRQKMTLAVLQRKTGIAQAALSRLERGQSANPTIDTIYRISAALGKSIGCFLQDAGKA